MAADAVLLCRAAMRPIANFSSTTTVRFAQRRRGSIRRPAQQLVFKPVNGLLRDLHQARPEPLMLNQEPCPLVFRLAKGQLLGKRIQNFTC